MIEEKEDYYSDTDSSHANTAGVCYATLLTEYEDIHNLKH